MLSGHPGTLPENSDIHLAIVYIIYRRHMISIGRRSQATIQEFKKHIGVVVAADDILARLSAKLAEIMNPEDFIHGYASLNMQVTAADKSEVLTFQNISDVHFLKMGFNKQDDTYKMYPKESIINQLLNWQRINQGRLEQFQVNMETAFRFAYFRGEKYYNELEQKVNLKLIQHGLPIFTYSYQDMGSRITRETEIHSWKNVNSLTNSKDRICFTEDYIIKHIVDGEIPCHVSRELQTAY